MTGDFLTTDSTEKSDIEYLEQIICSLEKSAPVYFSIGNQERFNPQLEKICETVENAGGTVLDCNYIDLNVNGNSLRIGGISYYRFWDEESNTFIRKFAKTGNDTFTLLLCHNPEFYLWGIKNYNIDLVVSGHTHGGMVKLPLFGPIYAPEQGWFPDYAAGLYEFPKGYLAVTTGLSASPKYLPRLFNRPEIMIIDLK